MSKSKKVMRMNNNTRFTMKNKAVALKFGKRESALEKQKTALSMGIYNYLYPVTYQLAMLELPSEVFSWRTGITIWCSDIKKLFKDKGMWGNLPTSFDFPNDFMLPIFRDISVPDKDLSPKLKKKVHYIMKKSVLLDNEKTEYSLKVHELLRGTSSVKKLLEVLPDAYDWLPDVEGCTDTPVADLASAVANA